MHRTIAILLPLTAAASLCAAPVVERKIASPNGSLVFTLQRDDVSRTLTYDLTCGGRAIINGGALGLELSGLGMIGNQATISRSDPNEIDTTWRNPFGERVSVVNRFCEETWHFTHPGHGSLKVKLQVRAYDEGIAIRYLLDGSGTITADRTTFPLPPNTRVWTSARAQSPISKQPVSAVTGAVDRPVLAELAADLYAAIGEAGLIDSARMKLTRSGTSSLAATLDGKVDFTGSFISPWRVVRVAPSPAALLQGNDIMLNLNEPSKITDLSWIRPGKVLREVTLTTTGAIACIDFAASHGLQHIMFDAGWYGPERSPQADATRVNLDPARSRGPLDLPAVLAHARTKQIGVILYVNQIALTRQLDQILPLYQSWGVAGIKFGFVNVGPQPETRWLHEAVAKCATHRLMVDIHDEYRPTGVSRAWPNLLTQEGIRGDEESPTNSAVLDTIFTRCLAGAGDQTNCYFAPRVPKMGSHASQLAKSVLIFSPWQFLFWYDRPGGPPGAPSVIAEVPELEFFKRLPTVWDETRWLDGYPGAHATVARRKGETWFIAALNGPATRDFRVPLDFLTEVGNHRLELYSDDPSATTATKVRIDTSVVNRSTVIARTVNAGNGFAAVLTPATEKGR